MTIRNHPKTPRRGNEPTAQGIALGSRTSDPRPERAKALDGGGASYSFFCPYRAGPYTLYTQGDALGY